MKKLIRYLSDISGVTTAIQREEARRIGCALVWDSYWFVSMPVVMDAMGILGENLKKYAHTGQVDQMRYDLYKKYPELLKHEQSTGSIHDKTEGDGK